MKILIVEDEPQLSDLMARSLKEQAFVVETASTLTQAVEKSELYEYDCVLLDLMLPDGNGLNLLERLLQKDNPPQVIITSAKASIQDKVSGLELGADDYLPKPFDLSELTARVKSQLRRRFGGKKTIRVGNVEISPDEKTACVDKKPLALLHKEYHILHYFLSRPMRVINKETLAEAVWGDHADQSDNYNYVYQQVANLKKKLKEAKASVSIQSVYGFGYRLTEEDDSGEKNVEEAKETKKE